MERVPKSSIEGALTYGSSKDFGTDTYDFGARAVWVRKTKERLGLQEKEPLPSPWTVEFEPTLICNARCHFCSYEAMLSAHRERIRKEKKAGEVKTPNGLPKDRVMGVLKELKEAGTTMGTFWSGGGEPLLWPYILDSVMEASTFSDVAIQTNGINLDKFTEKEEYLRAIRLLSVSVVGHNRELHKVVMGVNSFDMVTHNLEKIMAMRDRFGINIAINSKILVSKLNFKFLPDIVRHYRDELGADIIGIRLVQDYNYGGEGPREESLELSREEKQELINLILDNYPNDKTLSDFARVLALQMRAPRITSSCFNAIDGHFACIDPSGNVFLGNPEIGDRRFNIGNILEMSWRDIWKSERHINVANLMNQLQVRGECQNRLCRHVRANYGTEQYIAGDYTPPSFDETIKKLGAFL